MPLIEVDAVSKAFLIPTVHRETVREHLLGIRSIVDFWIKRIERSYWSWIQRCLWIKWCQWQQWIQRSLWEQRLVWRDGCWIQRSFWIEWSKRYFRNQWIFWNVRIERVFG